MSYVKIASVVLGTAVVGITSYVLGGEKHKKREERSDFKAGHNKGRAENFTTVKTANDNLERAIKSNKELSEIQNRIIALVVIGTAVAARKTATIKQSSFEEIVQAAGGIATNKMAETVEKKIKQYMLSPPSMKDAIKAAKEMKLSENECLEIIEVGMTVDGEPNDIQHAFYNCWKIEIRKQA